MISKKQYAGDGASSRFLSDFIIRSSEYARPYVYVYDETLDIGGAEDVLQDPGSAWSYPDNLYRRGSNLAQSADLVTIDKWQIVDNSVLFYTSPPAGTSVWVEVATTSEEFGETLSAPIIERAETAAENALVSKTAAAISASNALASETASGLSETASALSETSAATSASTATAQASNASTSASNALASETSADTSASTATTQAGISTAQAVIATTKASEASASASTASTAATTSTTNLGLFESQYESSPTPPLTPVGGMLWFDETTNLMKVYAGSIWVTAGSAVNGVEKSEEFIATGGQTLFTIASGYDVGFVNVFREGMLLGESEYTADNGSTVTLNVACIAGDIVKVQAFGAFSLADTYSISGADAAFVAKTSDTGSAVMPTGTEAQRDGVPEAGYLRFNNETNTFEGFDGTVWGAIGGGGAVDDLFRENGQIVSADYTVPSGSNASVVGDITINDGVTITVSDGSTLVIL